MRKALILISFLTLALGMSFGQAAVPAGCSGAQVAPGIYFSSTGLLCGTPTQAGTFSFTVQVCDTETPPACITAPESLTVNSALQIQSITLTAGVSGSPYPSVQFSASGGIPPLAWSANPAK